MRVALGVAVFSGMLGVTVFGLFFTPVFYVVIRWCTKRPRGSLARPPTVALPDDIPAAARPMPPADGPVAAHGGPDRAAP
jgi:hypothetical protein